MITYMVWRCSACDTIKLFKDEHYVNVYCDTDSHKMDYIGNMIIQQS